MNQIILHSDLNCFYASVEINENPALYGKCVAVCGSTENRHGIVLTASYPAKRCGVKTGMANWQALQACPGLIVVEPRYDLYLKYSRMVRKIYKRYANDIEPFGMDENWLSIDTQGSVERDGRAIAEEIRTAVRSEIGLTVSVGVSFSKIFAKLGSDMKKPDAVTVIGRGDYKEKVWPLPVSELLYVGPATTRKLKGLNIRTIGELAQTDADILRGKLGANGMMLWRFANACDASPVMPANYTVPIQSVGHGVTCVHDLDCEYDVWRVLYALAQDLGHRLRLNGMLAHGVQITVRDNNLRFEQYQHPLPRPTRSPLEIARIGYALFRERYGWQKPVRALTICATKPNTDRIPMQLDLFGRAARHEKRQTLDDAVDEIRKRFGESSIRAASLLGDLSMANDRCETVPMPGLMYR